jgi:hypothetical protein
LFAPDNSDDIVAGLDPVDVLQFCEAGRSSPAPRKHPSGQQVLGEKARQIMGQSENEKPPAALQDLANGALRSLPS